MTWLPLDSWIVATSALVAIACVLPGCFLFLSRQSMMSHGISHAVLPGIVIGHLVTGEVNTPALFIGAILAGIACAVLTRFLQRLSGVEEGAALGISFTTLFALGLVMQRLFADNVHIEPNHILMGNLEVAVFSSLSPESPVPQTFWKASVAVILNLVFIVAFFRELTISTFDPNHGDSVESRPRLMYYLLMTLSAITCVVAFEAVGSILVVAMIIMPPAIASFFTKSLKHLILLSIVIAVFGCFLGHLLSITTFGPLFATLFKLTEASSTNTAAGITIVLSAFLAIAFLWQKLRKA